MSFSPGLSLNLRIKSLQLERFVGLVRNEGGRFRQASPPDCVPLQSGREVLPLAHIVSG